MFSKLYLLWNFRQMKIGKSEFSTNSLFLHSGLRIMGQQITHPYYLTKKLTPWTMTIRALIVEKGMAEDRPTSHRIHRIGLLLNTSTEKQSGTSLRTVPPSPTTFLRWRPLRPDNPAFDTQTLLAGFFYLTFNGCRSLGSLCSLEEL